MKKTEALYRFSIICTIENGTEQVFITQNIVKQRRMAKLGSKILVTL